MGLPFAIYFVFNAQYMEEGSNEVGLSRAHQKVVNRYGSHNMSVNVGTIENSRIDVTLMETMPC